MCGNGLCLLFCTLLLRRNIKRVTAALWCVHDEMEMVIPMKRLLGGCAAIAMLASVPALAADMAARPIYKAPPPPPAPAYNWTGCYIGANLGGGWTHDEFHFGAENEGTLNKAGFVGGGQVGCDYQFGSNFVIGVQGMFDGTTIKGTDVDPNDTDRYPTTLHWFGTVTGRLGYLVTPSVLIYGKGGAAWVNESIDYFSVGILSGQTGDFTRNGWDAGGGLEWMFAPNWSAFVEFDHMGFGTKNVFVANVSPPGGFTETIKQSVDKVLVGVNWRFDLASTSRY